ncbi:outer membrane protein [Dysgonomonas sp. PH5-45]|uniref:TolC family protein n=1 Tax=unclassified Dysgonomonas TaxID=2630389 RepID=UPI002474E60E|nr:MULTISPECIES: TolC family protein [unclassified Dysgonomonas]MDH6355598.1 outer membrane protein [Dysgonomonas sp. PH5-45]MDH6388492.1 outer membrane protein [Dysgonomonas sp. PH5-37]
MKKYIISACLLLSVFSIQAQDKWTLRQCIDYAIKNNIEIKQQDVAVQSAEVDLSTSRNSRLPNLNASAGYSLGFGRAKTVSNSSEKIPSSSSSFSFGASSSMPLFTGFRISNEIAGKELDLKAAMANLEKAKENMELQVTSYYLDILFKKEILKVYQEQAALTQTQVEKTQFLVESGKVAASQLYDIKAQLANDELNITNSQNDLDLSLLNLSQLLNLQTDDLTFDIAEPHIGDVIMDNISSIVPPRHIYETAIAIKPHVKEYEYKLASSKKNLKVAQSGYWPTLDLRLNYDASAYFINDSKANNQSFFGQYKDSQQEAIGITLSIPIFNRFQTRNQVRTARLSIQNSELALDNMKLSLYKEIQQAYQSAIAAQAKYTSTEKSLAAATESFKYAKEKYEVGKSSVYEYNEANTKLISSKSEQVQAKYDFLFRAKILDFYSGKEIDIQ